MNEDLEKVKRVRKGLTSLVDTLSKVFCTEDVIDELMIRRKYNTSPYAKEMRDLLKEIGVFKFDYITELKLVCPSITDVELQEYGLVDRSGNYLLRGRFVVPIRDIASNVTALVGWYPDSRKYITTPTYGFSKDGQFFNLECYRKSANGEYPKNTENVKNGLVYLVEGIFDTLSLRALGFPALGNMGLEMSLVKSYILKRFGKVIAIPDNDKAGHSTNKYLNKVSEKSKKFIWLIYNESVIVQLPDEVKDVDDFIKGYYAKEDLLKCQEAVHFISLKDEE